MGNFNPDMISRAFEEKKKDVYAEVKKIYREIAARVSEKAPAEMVSAIIMLESKYMNEYISTLKSELKELAADLVVRSGMSEDVAEILWASVMVETEMPKVELCRRESAEIPRSASKPESKSGASSGRKRIESLKRERNLSAGIAVTGAVAETVSWIIIPGMGPVSVMVKAAGIVIIGVGAANALRCQSEINRIASEPDKKVYSTAEQKEGLRNFISQVCGNQAKYNSRHLVRWLDSISENLIDQCQKEME